MMTGRVTGKMLDEVTRNADPLANQERLGKLAVFEGVRFEPARA